MIHWRQGKVLEVIAERPGLQEITVSVFGDTARALVLTELVGRTVAGDTVIVNVTAVALGLGTGGKHFVAAILDRQPPDPLAPGHLIKLRYTPLQLRCRVAEEDQQLPESLDGRVVVVGELHSQLLPAALALRSSLGSKARLIYVMSDGGALPLAVSHTVAGMLAGGVIDGTVTIGHAFGGELEALNIYSGLLAACHRLNADVIIVMMGPGIAGTNSRFGHTGVEQALHSDAVSVLGGRAVLIPRLSFADRRARHHGVSHHTLTVCGRLIQRKATIALPVLDGAGMDTIFRQLAAEGIHQKHDLRLVVADEILALLSKQDLPASTMGRTPAQDPAFFLAAGAAGFLAARMHRR